MLRLGEGSKCFIFLSCSLVFGISQFLETKSARAKVLIGQHHINWHIENTWDVINCDFNYVINYSFSYMVIIFLFICNSSKFLIP